jgi:poly-beta-1,6-N-acetyl-D-glucosamine synthase
MLFRVSVGIPAYNEASNIAKLLNALINQKTCNVEISEIIVISSGSTDKTELIVEGFSRKDSRIKLLRESERKGKVSAINEFLKVAQNDIVVLESADTIPGEWTIERLCLPFEKRQIGMTGGHPVPLNDENSFMGYASHLEWALHDHISMRDPKCGELAAFRKIFRVIPDDIAVDEAWIEYELAKKNYKIVYVPEAIVYNRGSETVSDFLKQRRRIACGHLDLSKRTHFEVSTSNLSIILPAIFEVFPQKEPKKWVFFVGAFTLEILSRFFGYYDYYKRKEQHSVWEISKTTKNLDSYAK